MKKIIVLLIAVTSFTVSFAQQDNYRNRKDDHQQNKYENRNTDDRYAHNSKDYGYKDFDHNYNDRKRQAEIDRVNRDYDRRIYNYRNDHSMNSYQRERMIRNAEMERSQKIRAFGGGVVIGAVAGLVLGAILSH